MEPNDYSELSHVVVDFPHRTITLHGYDGEEKSITCEWTDVGSKQFQNMVNKIQSDLPPEMRVYQL